MDNPHGDPVTARAHHFTSSYLEPILHEWSAPPQPLIHGLVKPYHISPTARTSVITESALSRVLALILDRLNGSTTRQLTVSDNRGFTHLKCTEWNYLIINIFNRLSLLEVLHGLLS